MSTFFVSRFLSRIFENTFFAADVVVVVAVVVVAAFTKPKEQSEIKHKDFSKIFLALFLLAQEKQAKTLRLNKISKRIT